MEELNNKPVDGVATPEERSIIERGLTLEFRKSVAYKKMQSDILKIAPESTQFEVDTAIWWFISRPDLFTCAEGSDILERLQSRVAENIGKDHYKELEDDVVFSGPDAVCEARRLALLDVSGVHASESNNGSTTTSSPPSSIFAAAADDDDAHHPPTADSP
jgi:hypothetical protein